MAETAILNHGAAVTVTAWTLMTVSILFTAFRLFSNVVLRGQFGKDDGLIIGATLLAVGQTITTHLMVRYGLGQHQQVLSSSTIVRYEKTLVASSILYVSVILTSKCSILFLLNRIMLRWKKPFKLFIHAAWIIMASCFVAEVLALSFQCSFPDTYLSINGKCINFLAFWDFDTIFDISSSLIALVLPMAIIIPLQMNNSRKIQAVSAFGFQIPLCAFAIVRLIYLHRALNAQDHTWKAVNWQIWTQVNMHSHIIAANIPFLRIFLNGIQALLIRDDFTAQLAESDPNTSASQDRTGSVGAGATRRSMSERRNDVVWSNLAVDISLDHGPLFDTVIYPETAGETKSV